jgi:hypothetical protein
MGTSGHQREDPRQDHGDTSEISGTEALEPEGGPEITRQRHMTVRPDPDYAGDRPVWLRALDQVARELQAENPDLYGSFDRGGVTIGEGWHMSKTLTGIPMACALVEGRPSQGTESIPTVVTLAWPHMLRRLRRFFQIGGEAVHAAVHDGRSGHAISLIGCNGNRFVYSDPWPGDSLLCRHQNAAGVDAQEYGEENWTVTEDELALVLMGVNVLPSLWAEASGQPGALRYSELRESEFWSFFGVHEREGDDDFADLRTIHLSTGGFTDRIALRLGCDGYDRISRATLRLRADWAVGPPWGLDQFALDIARSFMSALAPAADKAAVQRVLPPPSPVEAVALLRSNSHREPSWTLIAAYAGVIPDTSLVFSMSALEVSRPDEGWIEVKIKTF